MSRFVSGGTNDAPIERDAEWLQAQQEIEARRLQKLDEGNQQDGRSLYEVLQANKAAKQDAFEEKIKLKNQFRSLDDDEVDFLDSVLESTRVREAEVRKETQDQLSAFRKQREEAEKSVATHEEPVVDLAQGQWASKGRKRRKSHGKENAIGLKLRKTSSTGEGTGPMELPSGPSDEQRCGSANKSSATRAAAADAKSRSGLSATAEGTEKESASPPAAGLGLAGYSSNEDD